MNNVEVWQDISQCLTLEGVAQKDGRKIVFEDLSAIDDAVIVVGGKKILWVGVKKELKTQIKVQKWKVTKTHSLRGCLVLPAFVECHTHLVFAGDRSQEFEWRNSGLTYQQIAERGGGIKSTMAATKKASIGDLKKMANRRVERLIKQGVTTVEIKTGYGESVADELKLCEVIESIKNIRCVGTYLGAHALPNGQTKSDFLNDRLAAMKTIIKKFKSIRRADMFIEKGYFDLTDAEVYFGAAKRLGFDLVGHCEQLNHTGGAAWLIRYGAKSVDHLVQISDSDIKILAESNTVGVLLPTADLYLKMAYPPARKLIDQNVCVALSTDYNPGTAPSLDLSLVGVLARLNMAMTLPEVIAAYTFGAAKALGLENQIGSLLPGKSADFVAFDCKFHELFYDIGHHPVQAVISGGKLK